MSEAVYPFAVVAELLVPRGDVFVRPLLAQGGVAVFKGVLVVLPSLEEVAVVVEESVVGKAAAVFGSLVDEGEVVAVDDLNGDELGEFAEAAQVFAVKAQEVVAAVAFYAEQVAAAVAVQFGDKAEVVLSVADDVASLAFAEGFAASEHVESFQ